MSDAAANAGNSPPPANLLREQTVPFSRWRCAIARRLTQSVRTIPHFYVSLDADVTAALAWRSVLNEGRGLHITVTDLVAKAASLVLREFPRFNAHVGEDSIAIKPAVGLGIAVATKEGLLVPVIPEADRISLTVLSELSRKSRTAARKGRIVSTAVGTFTLSSLGMYGVRQFLPIINPPECGILAVGAAEPRVVPTPDGIAVRQVMTMTLGCDHRAVDGAEAAQFLSAVKSSLEGAADVLSPWV